MSEEKKEGCCEKAVACCGGSKALLGVLAAFLVAGAGFGLHRALCAGKGCCQVSAQAPK